MQVVGTRTYHVQFPDIFPTPVVASGAKIVIRGVTIASAGGGGGQVALAERDTTTIIMKISVGGDTTIMFDVPFIADKGLSILLPFADIRVAVIYQLS